MRGIRMAERRMFTMKIVDSDAFLEMPMSTQSLYFHLNMRADDDGFVNNPKRIQRMIGASEDDLKILLAKRFILGFENGVVVIKHWRMHNLLRKDRYNPTQYIEEKATLTIKGDGAYTEKEPIECLATTWQPSGNQMATQDRLGKDSIGKESIVEDIVTDSDESKPQKRKRFVPPTLEEVRAYCLERKNNVDPKKFFDYFTASDWYDSKGKKVKSWKQKVITWEGFSNNKVGANGIPVNHAPSELDGLF
jgi:hypothetical protein